MNIHEFQAKQLFAQFGVPVPRGKEIKTPRAAEKWAVALEAPVYVVKAQIHAGGRGKAGGVKITKQREEVAALTRELIGKTLVTHQTGPKGRKVRALLIEEGGGDRQGIVPEPAGGSGQRVPHVPGEYRRGNGNRRGGGEDPEKLFRETIDPGVGFHSYNGRNLAFALGLPSLEKAVVTPFIQMLGNLYRLFMEKNASLVEINPLVITTDKQLVASTGRSPSTTTRCTNTRTSRRFVICTRKNRLKSRRAPITSIT